MLSNLIVCFVIYHKLQNTTFAHISKEDGFQRIKIVTTNILRELILVQNVYRIIIKSCMKATFISKIETKIDQLDRNFSLNHVCISYTPEWMMVSVGISRILSVLT